MHLQAWFESFLVLHKHAALFKTISCQKIMMLRNNVVLTAGKEQSGIAGRIPHL